MIAKLLSLSLLLTQTLCSLPWVGQPRDGFWVREHQRLLNQTEENSDDIKLVFIGDSITWGWSRNGSDIWNATYAPRHAYNYGIGGDKIENVIYRVENGELDGIKPKAIVLMIGKN